MSIDKGIDKLRERFDEDMHEVVKSIESLRKLNPQFVGGYTAIMEIAEWLMQMTEDMDQRARNVKTSDERIYLKARAELLREFSLYFADIIRGIARDG